MSAHSHPFAKPCSSEFLLSREAVLSLCESLSKGSHAHSEAHMSPAKETVSKAPHQAFSPCGFLTAVLTQIMSSDMLPNSRSAWREAQPVSSLESMTPAWSRIHWSSPRHCRAAGCFSFSPLPGCLQLHVLEHCQAGALICFYMASNNHRSMFSGKYWCACLCNHT